MPKTTRWFSAVLAASSLLALGVTARPAFGQDTTTVAAAAPTDPRELAERSQNQFEIFRRNHLVAFRGRKPSPGKCPEPVGMAWCYWYDESPQDMKPTPEVIVERTKLIDLLDSLGREQPGDPWIAGQRVRYLIEAERLADALDVAKSCQTVGWWCDGLTGLALHELGRFAEAEARFELVLAELSPRDRCVWRDLTPFLDDDTRRQYIRSQCDSPERAAYEQRVWWFARTRYGMEGNDSRTEHFARLTYIEILKVSATAHHQEFDEAARELLLRFGWERGWARDSRPSFDAMRSSSTLVDVIGFEATPAHRLIPPSHVLTSPASSDSVDWAVQLPPVIARYHPKYASRLLMLEHQQALFRRGDTALMVLAYDVSKVKGIEGAKLDAALVLTPGTTPKRGTMVHVANAPAKGTMSVRAPWGPLLMSAEIAADSASTLLRARYGIRPPFALGARVSLSDLLFYTPFGTFPTTVEEALPHALATQKVRSGQKLGVYWEAYNTNPQGEKMTISMVVAPEGEDESGRGSRVGRALRLSRGNQSVSVTVEDMSARGSRTSPRSVEVDISTLKPGAYLVQLEIDVAGQYTIRADRRLVVVAP